ncbi:MAG: DUF366 family protein [Deltaproteobacteria bacterium]
MKIVQTKFINKRIIYDGTQLAPHWIYKNFDILGDAIVGFIGPADVPLKNMVDLEDVKSQSPIYSELMLHFIAEFFDTDLEKAIYRQRLLMVIMKECLEKRIGKSLQRRGDDLFDGKRKLTVSIATASPVSALIHAGINIKSKNTPVLTAGLIDYQLSAKSLALEIVSLFKRECDSIWKARCKVQAR